MSIFINKMNLKIILIISSCLFYSTAFSLGKSFKMTPYDFHKIISNSAERIFKLTLKGEVLEHGVVQNAIDYMNRLAITLSKQFKITASESGLINLNFKEYRKALYMGQLLGILSSYRAKKEQEGFDQKVLREARDAEDMITKAQKDAIADEKDYFERNKKILGATPEEREKRAPSLMEYAIWDNEAILKDEMRQKYPSGNENNP